MSSLASVFIGDRWADPASQEYPMSTTSGLPWRWWEAPGGHCQYAISQKRVAPTTRSPEPSCPLRTVANATWAPDATFSIASAT